MVDAIGGISAQVVTPRPKAEGVDVQSLLRSALAKTGGDATVTVQYGYSVGADGSLQVSSATVSTVEKTLGGVRVGELPSNTAAPLKPVQLLKLEPAAQAEVFSLSAEEQALIRELQSSDVAIRNHELLHFRNGAGITSGTPEYTLTQGPDGNYYAVGGAVNVQTSRGVDADQQAREAQTFTNAATAPGDASAQDLSAARSFGFSKGIAAYKSAVSENSVSAPETKSSPEPLDISA